jgi:hypothetical protein
MTLGNSNRLQPREREENGGAPQFVAITRSRSSKFVLGRLADSSRTSASPDRGGTRRDDHIDFVLHQFRCKIGKAIEVAVGIKVFGFDGAALDISTVGREPCMGVYNLAGGHTGSTAYPVLTDAIPLVIRGRGPSTSFT